MEAAPLRLLGEIGPHDRIVVPQLQAEPHVVDPSPMSDGLFPQSYLDARARYRAFMEEHVYPNESAIEREDDDAVALVDELRALARDAGLWAPHVPPEAGGTGLGFLYYACLNEEIGRSSYAQLVFGCQAPDAGNAEILHLFGTDEQKERFLRPLVAGEARSFFSMTEPEVAGSDPTLLRTRAVREGDEWVIDGHKWFSSGADGAAFAIVFAITDPEAQQHRRGTMILVPADTAGVDVVRPVPVMGHAGRGWNTHCEVRFSGVRVPVTNTLGGAGDAFLLAQKRLGPGRIHHVMRWLGQMQRAFELMCRYANAREAFGGPLADKQTVQNWIADSAAGIQACRLLTMDAARKIDEGSEARVEVSLLKFYAAGVLCDVIDRAIQVHGARGLTDETPLARMAMNARAARIYDGPDEVHRMVVARQILRSFRDGDGWAFS
jgi:alkylation response protein AidB-like acyl-CoA dehydrogenase